MQPINISYELTVQDYIEAQRAHRDRKLGKKILRVAATVAVAFILLCGILLIILSPSEWTTAVPVIVFTGVLLALSQGGLVWRWQYSKIPRPQMKSSASLTDVGLHAQNEVTQVQHQWSAFQGYLESKNLFMLYQRHNFFNILPKRALSPEQVTDLRSFLAEKVKRIGH